MADATTKGALRPSLLDRLLDDEPDRRSERAREPRRGVDDAALRESVRRDLDWLFNATRLACTVDLERYPEVRRSVLNFGFVDLAGRTLSGVDTDTLAAEITAMLHCYEPRLLPDGLTVRVEKGMSRTGAHALIIDIQSELWALPVPLALHLRTEVDLESGRVAVHELARNE